MPPAGVPSGRSVADTGRGAATGAAGNERTGGVSREHVLGYLLWCAIAVPAVWLLFAVVLVPLMSLDGGHALYLGLPAYVIPVPLTAFFIPALGVGPSGSS